LVQRSGIEGRDRRLRRYVGPALNFLVFQMTSTSPSTLLHAQGKLVAFVAAMLQAAGIQQMEEFAALLGVFAATVAEEDAAQGEILAYWATIVRDGAPPTGNPELSA
jgi:hypothetical protein